jgi:hypothetical protein
MTPAERSYRRVLWLLPADYRQFWEEDMVGAYLDSVGDSRRRSVGEWFAVVWLALRLRLNGSHVSPRARIWHQTVLGIAIFTTLYESLAATVWFAQVAAFAIKLGAHDPDLTQGWLWWDAGSGLIWVPIFVCLVLGRLVAARVLVFVAVAHGFGITVRIAALVHPSLSAMVPNDPDRIESYIYLTILVLTGVAVLLVPRGLRPSRGWLAAYLVPTAVMVFIGVASVPDRSDIPTVLPRWLQVLQVVNVGQLLHAGLIVGMIVALARARRWLLPLAVFSGAVAAGQLAGYDYGDVLGETLSGPWIGVNAVQLLLAVACAVVGFIDLLRGVHSGAAAQRDDE